MEPITRTIAHPDWITLTLVGSLVLLLLAKSFFYTRFMNFMILPFNNKYIGIYIKKEKLFNWFHILVSVFQIINTALFMYLIWLTYIETSTSKNPLIFFLFLILVLAFLSAKTILQLFNGFVFSSYKTFNELIFRKLSYLNYAGIVLFIANVFLIYVFPLSKIIIPIALFFFLMINLIGWITVIKNYQKFIGSYFFYFILYLCALEIAPLVIMGSFLK